MILLTRNNKNRRRIKMEKERKVRVLSIAALLVAVLGLTVAFAALSQTLTINGSAAVNTATWDIHFEKTSGTETEVKGAATFTEPTLSGTTIENFSVTLTKPGDSVTYYFDIVNKGTVDAVVSSYNFSYGYTKCLGSREGSAGWEDCKAWDLDNSGTINSSDKAKYMELFDYNIYYVDGGKKLTRKDTLNAGETKRMKLVIEYKDTATELPENNMTLTSSDPITITYEQAD